ncbi:MAG: hypothetical protein MO852_02880, partial [Candidatus Devosia euplotis]|nr:hypothetical protein [Candidatus Devosia euplotis]
AQHQGLRLAACTPFVIVLADETMSLRPLLLDAALKIRTQIGPTTSTNSIEFMKRQLADAQSITFLAETDASVQPQMLSLVQRANAGLDRSAVLFLEQARAALELLGR